MPDVNASDLMKEVEAADMLLMSPKTLANRRSRGDEVPPFIRLPGGGIRYSRRAVARWIEENTVLPGGASR